MRITFILSLAILIALPHVAFAAGNTITVKNPDGTTTSIDIGPQMELPTHKDAAKPVKKPEVKAATKPAQKSAAKPVKKPAAKETAVKKEAAKKAVSKKDSAPKNKKSAKQKTAKKQTSKQAAAKAPVAAQAQAPSRPQRLGPAMTSDDAIRIALDAAPPARSVHAFPVNYKGLHAYQVVFATEDGERSLFVNRETGKLVR